jgi:hypothetical protein
MTATAASARKEAAVPAHHAWPPGLTARSHN